MSSTYDVVSRECPLCGADALSQQLVEEELRDFFEHGICGRFYASPEALLYFGGASETRRAPERARVLEHNARAVVPERPVSRTW